MARKSDTDRLTPGDDLHDRRRRRLVAWIASAALLPLLAACGTVEVRGHGSEKKRKWGVGIPF